MFFILLCSPSIGEVNIEVNVFPNPTAESFMIQSPGQFAFVLQDMKGAVLLSDTANDNTEVSLEQFETGTYILTLPINNHQFTQKVVKY